MDLSQAVNDYLIMIYADCIEEPHAYNLLAEKYGENIAKEAVKCIEQESPKKH